MMEDSTNGTKTPEEAVNEAAKILITHFQLISSEKQPEVEPEPDSEESKPSVEVLGEKE